MKKRKRLGIVGEFKTFITRGNVIDLAVGVLIGAAFNKIVTSLVNDVITPVVSFLTGLLSVGGFNIAEWTIKLREGAVVNVGSFIMTVADFLITAAVVFLIVKLFNTLNETAGKLPINKKDEETVEEKTDEKAKEKDGDSL